MRRVVCVIAAMFATIVAVPAHARDKINVAVSLTILADFARNVGGDRVDVVSLVGPNGDAHSYVPSPADAKKLADAKLIILDGLGLERIEPTQVVGRVGLEHGFAGWIRRD